MVLVQGFETQVRVHMADYTDHTYMDYSPLALASGNTCVRDKKKKKKKAHFSCKTLMMLICK